MPQLRAAVRLCGISTEEERPDRVAAVRAIRVRIGEGLDTLDLREADAILG